MTTPAELEQLVSDLAQIVRMRGEELSTARRELAETRVVWEVVNKVSSILFATEQEADSYIGQFPISIGLTKIRRDVFKSPAQGATSTAPQARECLNVPQGQPVQPAAAVPDDPVEAYKHFSHKCAEQTYVIRALAAHYEARGMRKAAEICKERAWTRPASRHLGAEINCTECANAILSAAAELERKP